MKQSEKIEHLKNLLNQLAKIKPLDHKSLTRFFTRLDMILGKVFPIGSDKSIRYRNAISTTIFDVDTNDRSIATRAWGSGIDKITGILETIIDDIELSENEEVPDGTKIDLNKIFVVHGHNNAMKLDVARFIEKLGLVPIILDEQPNQGHTLIEKFVKHSNVGYAIVCISPDDKGCRADTFPQEARFRARQNVVLELGFFTGRLGRDKVLPLAEKVDDFETPSDYLGIAYTVYSAQGDWKNKVAKELKACGYDIDMNCI